MYSNWVYFSIYHTNRKTQMETYQRKGEYSVEISGGICQQNRKYTKNCGKDI